MKTVWAAASFIPLVLAGSVQAHDQDHSFRMAGSKDATIRQVYDHPIPGVPGKSIRGVLVEYGPGGYSPSHRHARSAIIYATVIQGAIRSQVNNGSVKTYHEGENWTEMPGDHHRVSANASEVEPAKILAVFVADTAETQLTIPDGSSPR
jgi:quercetin dioxygenase-like cupin family protein